MNYDNLVIEPKNIEEENNILNKVFKCIDDNSSFLYDTGAGAGKTYALKETLVYILQSRGKELKKYNQNILCITYTNVAVKEIKDRLGNTSIVLTSTIHDRIWNIIKRFRNELLKLHKEKLIKEIQNENDFINNDPKSKWYRENIDQKDEFIHIIKVNINDYYLYYNQSAAEFKNNFIKKYFEQLNITNVANFKDTVSKLILLDKNNEALSKIESGKNKKVEYDPRINSDHLYKFQISHDTLLEYAEDLISKYSTLQRLLVDKFPIIFVDEYQDTDKKIINFINFIRKKSIEINRPVCVGLFGDSKQSIYENGIGDQIYDLTKDYIKIKNNFNRRSCNEIVKFANKIRNDDIKQKSIYKDFCTDECTFKNNDFTDKCVEEIKVKWNISIENNLHCFLLKNESVAEKNNFKSVYDVFSKYSKYDQLNSELFSNDDFKLGDVELLFKKLISFKINLENSFSLINNFIDLKNNNYNIINIDQMMQKFKNIKGDNLSEYINSFFTELKNDEEVITYILGKDIKNINDFKNKIIFTLLKDKEDPNLDLEYFLNLTMDELINWYRYIMGDFKNYDVVYQTLHSTKGLQYDNVVIELSDQFARDKRYFKRYFENYNLEDNLIGKELEKYKEAQNLLYVGITRATKNLQIYYKFDDTNENLLKNIDFIFNSKY